MLFDQCRTFCDGNGGDDDEGDNAGFFSSPRSVFASFGIPSTNRSLTLGEDDETMKRKKNPKTQLVVIEIVGATGLAFLDAVKVDEKTENTSSPTASSASTTQQIRKPQDDEDDDDMVVTTKDCYATICQDGTQVHTTKTILDDTSPIFTISTNSLAFLQIPVSALYAKKNVTISLYQTDSVVGNISLLNIGKRLVGSVELSYEELLLNDSKKSDERREFSIHRQYPVKLALRYRTATENDEIFYQAYKKKNNQENLTKAIKTSAQNVTHDLGLTSSTTPTIAQQASDLEFRYVNPKQWMQSNTSSRSLSANSKKKEKLYRVWPNPDPDRSREETTFLSKSQLQEECLKPSTQWVQGGSGEYGRVYIEVLKCDHLPNMDNEMVGGLTDAFCAMVFEDTFVRTSIIHDSLHPKWMPWACRAFCFPIQHPSSFLMLGVFDYDAIQVGLQQQHEPMGRVVIHLDAFQPKTVYTMTYPLQRQSKVVEEEGGKGQVQPTITIRLRVDWNNNIHKAMKAQTRVPMPRFFINSRNGSTWQILRYLCRGPVEMDQVSIESVKAYATELKSHLHNALFLIDSFAEVLLWRGRIYWNFWGKERSLYCPIHSVALLAASTTAIMRPDLGISIFLYSIAYLLLWSNYQITNHPVPWQRVRSFLNTLKLSLIGQWWPRLTYIDTNEGVEQAKRLHLLKQYRTLRVQVFLQDLSVIASRISKIKSKTAAKDISTQKGTSLVSKLYVNYLQYGHTALQAICLNIRVMRDFWSWKGATYKVTMLCLFAATFWVLIPKEYVQYTLLAAAWTWLGPWVKVVDMLIFQKYYRTSHHIRKHLLPELPHSTAGIISHIKDQGPNKLLWGLLKSKTVQNMVMKGRLVTEETLALQHFRNHMFGSYSERIPSVDTSGLQSIPLSELSFAQPYSISSNDKSKKAGYYIDIPSESKRTSVVKGQKLQGSIIPTTIDHYDKQY